MKLIALAVAGIMLAAPAFAAPSMPAQKAKPVFRSLETTVAWVQDYPRHHDLAHAPLAIRALSAYGAFRDTENAGTYVGFIAGLIGSNPDKADAMIDAMLPVGAPDEWVIVRGIAYSGHPQWRELLQKYSEKLPTRQVMIAGYLSGHTPTLGALAITPGPTGWERFRANFAVDWSSGKKQLKPQTLEPSQGVLDTLWGYYVASGSYGPLLRIVALLPWSKDRDDVERLTIGSMAKYTLAVNALRDRDLLGKLKFIRNARAQDPEMVTLLDETIKAAESADTAKLRKTALSAIEQLKTKGPGYKRDANTWAKVGQGALAVGCVTAAFLGQVYMGLPCVVGGGATSAAMYYMNE